MLLALGQVLAGAGLTEASATSRERGKIPGNSAGEGPCECVATATWFRHAVLPLVDSVYR